MDHLSDPHPIGWHGATGFITRMGGVGAAAMDAITLLKDDHKTVEKLFKRFEKAGDEAYTEKRDIVDRIIEELSKHAAIEEMLFYPVTRATVPDTDDIVLESLEEHHVVKWVLDELDGMDPQHERFDAKVTVLIENVRHHVEEEEDEYFPKVRDELGRKALGELGDAMEEARKGAPTHPHPRSPDTPPGNVISDTGAGMVDRVSDTVSGVAQGGVSALQDVIARVTGLQKPTSTARGNSQTKRAAANVRGGAAEVADRITKATKEARDTGKATTDRALKTARSTGKAAGKGASATAGSAGRAAKKTAGAATSGAKGTTTSAKRAAKSTGRTAKASAKATGRTAKASAKATGTTAKRAAKSTGRSAKASTKRTTTTAKRAATTTGRTAKASAKRTTGTAKKAASNTRKAAAGR